MASVNKAIILGNLGRDPEIRYTQSGKPVASLAVATSERYKDRDGETQEKTEWHNITLFDRLAEVADEYLKKGSPVYIEGRIRTEKYTDKEGVDRYATKIVADRMQLIGSRGNGNDDDYAGATPGGNAGSARQGAASGSRGSKGGGGGASGSAPQPDSFYDDDIPFVFDGLSAAELYGVPLKLRRVRW